jgi:predicted GNAT family N-acyltransferase
VPASAADAAGAGELPAFAVVTVSTDDPRYALARELRYGVLYAPWDLSRELIEDTDGRVYVHAIVEDDAGAVIGYARLHLEAGESKVYQVAVADDWRGRGVGRELMTWAAAKAREEGRDFVELDARETAIGFYERLGYTVVGDSFLSGRTGTPHRRMRRSL